MSVIVFIFNFILISLCTNCFFFCWEYPILIPAVMLAFSLANVMPSFSKRKFCNFRIRMCYHGNQTLKIFLLSAAVSVIYHIVIAFYVLPEHVWLYVISLVLCIWMESIFFLNGIVSLYSTSLQMGIRTRLIGVFCGMIPLVNLIVLGKILRITSKEVDLENKKAELNASRKDKQICKTKYPILLVHGAFLRDYKFFNYWGRIPAELRKNGAEIYYGNHQSARAVADSAAEVAARIKEIIEETGSEKVNIIAHSKGGLDCRYAIRYLGVEQYVASLTTVCSPHRGCKYADYLLNKASPFVRRHVEKAYNSALKKLGDQSPDFIAAVTDLTFTKCEKFNEDIPKPEGIRCSSVGTLLNRSIFYSKFPFATTYLIVRKFDGENDGLVGEDSFEWGDSYELLRTRGHRGISHGDIIDMNRENLPEFDVREYYVKLVENLKNEGY